MVYHKVVCKHSSWGIFTINPIDKYMSHSPYGITLQKFTKKDSGASTNLPFVSRMTIWQQTKIENKWNYNRIYDNKNNRKLM